MISKSAKVSAKRWVVWEYRLYFTLIFLATLPHTIVLCFLERVGVLKRKSYSNDIFRMKVKKEILLAFKKVRESLSGTEVCRRKAHEKLWAQSSYPEDF